MAGGTGSCHNEPRPFGSLLVALIVLRTLLIVALLLLAAALAGWLHSATAGLWVLVVGLTAQVVYHATYLSRLHHWAGLPRQRDLPFGLGSWGHAFDRLLRFMRQEAGERADTAHELERLHAAVDLLPDGLVVLDRYDHVQWSNRAAQALHGIFGARRPIDHFVRQPEFVSYLRAGDFSRGVLLTLPTHPGRTFSLKVVPTAESYRLLITRDVTDATRLDQMRRDFVANVSHEIRTPLTVIAGFVETLLDMELPADERQRCLQMVQRQAATMQRLVEDLLMLASLEAATAPAESAEVDVGGLLHGIAADMRALSGGRHAIEVAPPAAQRLLAAPAELASAVRNLMTNAVRYTPEGGHVTVSWTVREGEGTIAVRDTGVGIAAEHVPRLTERFYRVDRGRSREAGGTGLGLAIVKHIAQRHAARLDVESRPGVGSTFSLRFPAGRVLPAGSAAATAPVAPEAQAGAA